MALTGSRRVFDYELIGPTARERPRSSTDHRLLNDVGDVSYRGSRSRWPPTQIAGRDRRTFQEPRAFARLTVLDNVLLASEAER